MVKQILSSLTGRGRMGFFSGARMGVSTVLLDAPLVAFEAAHARRGEVPSIVGPAAAGWLTFPLIAGSLIEFAVPPVAAVALAAIPVAMMQDGLGRAIREFSQFNRQTRRLHMGGSYTDSENAQALRMRAISDMNASLIPARRVLGSEALLMHR